MCVYCSHNNIYIYTFSLSQIFYSIIYLTSQARKSIALCIYYYDHVTVIQPCHNNSLNSTHSFSPLRMILIWVLYQSCRKLHCVKKNSIYKHYIIVSINDFNQKIVSAVEDTCTPEKKTKFCPERTYTHQLHFHLKYFISSVSSVTLNLAVRSTK